MHLVAAARDGFRMSAILRDFKKFTANKIIGMIKEFPESRRAFLLNQFEEEGLSDKRITKGRTGCYVSKICSKKHQSGPAGCFCFTDWILHNSIP